MASPLYPFQALIKDATGATFPLTIRIPNTKPAVAVSLINGVGTTGCATSDGYVTLQASGGLPPYSYSIDMVNWQTSATFNNLTAGDYTFFVKDANGCTGQKMWFENAPTCDVSEGYETPGYFYSICGAPVSIYVVPRGIPLPLAFSIDNGSTWQTGPEFVVNTGQYTIPGSRVSGAFYLFHLPVFPSCPLTLNTSIQDATCGNSDGSITANAGGGAPPYSYSVDGIHFQNGNSFSGLMRRQLLYSPGHGRQRQYPTVPKPDRQRRLPAHHGDRHRKQRILCGQRWHHHRHCRRRHSALSVFHRRHQLAGRQ